MKYLLIILISFLIISCNQPTYSTKEQKIEFLQNYYNTSHVLYIDKTNRYIVVDSINKTHDIILYSTNPLTINSDIILNK
jgi:hypothetical protein